MMLETPNDSPLSQHIPNLVQQHGSNMGRGLCWRTHPYLILEILGFVFKYVMQCMLLCLWKNDGVRISCDCVWKSTNHPLYIPQFYLKSFIFYVFIKCWRFFVLCELHVFVYINTCPLFMISTHIDVWVCFLNTITFTIHGFVFSCIAARWTPHGEISFNMYHLPRKNNVDILKKMTCTTEME